MVPKLISVVDDDESVRRTTKLLIESFGYRASIFESAGAFLKSGQLNDTCCLVVDVQMPGHERFTAPKASHCRGLVHPDHFH